MSRKVSPSFYPPFLSAAAVDPASSAHSAAARPRTPRLTGSSSRRAPPPLCTSWRLRSEPASRLAAAGNGCPDKATAEGPKAMSRFITSATRWRVDPSRCKPTSPSFRKAARVKWRPRPATGRGPLPREVARPAGATSDADELQSRLMAVIRDVDELTPERALVFRLTHIDNMPWILANGLHCSTSETHDPDFVSIGNTDLIQRRRRTAVLVGPRQTLADYVPFYFTSRSPMLLNIRTGRGVTRRKPEELVILVVSLRSLVAHGVPFVISDRHAALQYAKFWTTLAGLDSLAWGCWQQRDFKRDQNDPSKFERYNAEALIHRHLPIERIEGIVCSGEQPRTRVVAMQNCGGEIEVVCRRHWFF